MSGGVLIPHITVSIRDSFNETSILILIPLTSARHPACANLLNLTGRSRPEVLNCRPLRPSGRSRSVTGRWSQYLDNASVWRMIRRHYPNNHTELDLRQVVGGGFQVYRLPMTTMAVDKKLVLALLQLNDDTRLLKCYVVLTEILTNGICFAI